MNRTMIDKTHDDRQNLILIVAVLIWLTMAIFALTSDRTNHNGNEANSGFMVGDSSIRKTVIYVKGDTIFLINYFRNVPDACILPIKKIHNGKEYTICQVQAVSLPFYIDFENYRRFVDRNSRINY